MKKISIHPTLQEKCPSLQLACIEHSVSIHSKEQSEHPELWDRIDTKIQELKDNLTIELIGQLPNIRASREAYKILGKEPSRYRLSAEALLRRIVKGKGLYQINNAVDLLNLVSISTGFSIGGYDLDKIEGDVVLGIGQTDEPYEAIGRGTLNIEFLPVFRDDKGAFGTPTSDSVRTMVTNSTQRFLMVILDFGGNAALNNSIGHQPLSDAVELANELLTTYGK